MGPIASEVDRRLRAAFSPSHLVVHDDSHRHAGHGGYREGVETHLRLEIVADAFSGLGRLARQRAILSHLADLMDNPIHALQMTAKTPSEAA
jgi:BolA protein